MYVAGTTSAEYPTATPFIPEPTDSGLISTSQVEPYSEKSVTINDFGTPAYPTCDCKMPTCKPGYRPATFSRMNSFCPQISCVAESVCVVGNDVYHQGSIVPQSDVCQTCKCSSKKDNKSQFYAVNCQPIVCNTNCKKGFIYKTKAGVCCGECVPLEKPKCIVKGSNGMKISIEIGHSYYPTNNTCVHYECDANDDQPILTKVKQVCQQLDISRCQPNTLKQDENGCCQTCTYKEETCSARKLKKVLRDGSCSLDVELTYCGGPCMGGAIDSETLEGGCSCCRQKKTQRKTVNLVCPGKKYKRYTYTDVVECGCASSVCSASKISGEAHSKTSGEADLKSSRHASSETSGEADSKASGESDPENSRDAAQKASGEADSKTSGEADSKTSGEADSKTSGEADSKTSGEADSKTSGEADLKTSGEADSKTSRETDSKESIVGIENTSGEVDLKIPEGTDPKSVEVSLDT
ncbi:intestinal mucin-like protein [Xenopus laevis]|uniref:Intestinal mucin-like protein n=1 Tax=Xenopus laevis TaxID=8355 RepID=A0A8J1KKM6_XENLA|nr:intestinal mucin-like protein [Xenopus laevis]